MRLYSLSVLRVDIAERDSVVGIVASEEKPEKKKNSRPTFENYRNTKIHEWKYQRSQMNSSSFRDIIILLWI